MGEIQSFEDEHPFAWFDPTRPEALRKTFTPMLAHVIDGIEPGERVLDVGCGAGRTMIYMGSRGLRCFGVDISTLSLRQMSSHSGRPGIRADNGCLPFPDGAIDVVVSDGVVHHTPDARRSFTENCRILRPEGRMYLAVYRPGGRYELFMRSVARPIRWAMKYRIGRALIDWTLVPLYLLMHRFKEKGTRSYEGAKNLFYDAVARPIIEFFSREEIESWANENGMVLEIYDANPNENVHCFVLTRSGIAEA